MTIPTFTINLDSKCDECGKPGRAPSGLCLSCTMRAIQAKKMRSATGRAVQDRWRASREQTVAKKLERPGTDL